MISASVTLSCVDAAHHGLLAMPVSRTAGNQQMIVLIEIVDRA